jgi:LmbE family N-acetylglucosaminyl deacetylase
MPDTILFVVAHPDDETIFFGASIAALASSGARVDVVCVTGDFGTPAYSAIREAEFRTACWQLGTRPQMLGLRDCRGALPLDAVQSALAIALRHREYDAVYTHGVWGEYGHPHHRNVCLAVHRVFGNGVLSLAGPLPPCSVKSLTMREWQAKRALAASVYRSQRWAPNWCSAQECFTRISPREAEFISRLADGRGTRTGGKVSPRNVALMRASLAAFGLPIPFAEVALIPPRLWKPTHATYAAALRRELTNTSARETGSGK